jgi:cytochrome bd-type quinol oxidase subunit 2
MSFRRTITQRNFIVLFLIAQVVALVLFPPDSFSPTSQEWWLPVLLVIMVIIADVELIARRGDRLWPWYLISFANGFNIISRLMMLWPHATVSQNGVNMFNAPYVLLTVVSMALSAFMLIYTEWPEVRMGLLRAFTPTKA